MRYNYSCDDYLQKERSSDTGDAIRPVILQLTVIIIR